VIGWFMQTTIQMYRDGTVTAIVNGKTVSSGGTLGRREGHRAAGVVGALAKGLEGIGDRPMALPR